MEKIILTAQEKALIEKHLAGQYNPFFATEVEQALFVSPISLFVSPYIHYYI